MARTSATVDISRPNVQHRCALTVVHVEVSITLNEAVVRAMNDGTGIPTGALGELELLRGLLVGVQVEAAQRH